MRAGTEESAERGGRGERGTCREILWFSYGSAAGYGGYYGGYGYFGYGGGYGEILTFVCLFVNSIPEKLLDRFRRNLVGGLGMVQGSCH